MIIQVINRGERGIMLESLKIAKELHIETGGMAPKYYTTDEGIDLTLKSEYNLIESKSTNYTTVSTWNVENSDGTIVLGNNKIAANKLVIGLCSKLDKPCLLDPSTSSAIQNWIEKNNIQVLHIVGNKADKLNDNQLANYRLILTNSLKTNQLI